MIKLFISIMLQMRRQGIRNYFIKKKAAGKIMEKRKVTMKDIAREVNVSVATVSYVLNYSDKEKISNETRVKIMEAAKRLHYVPNLAARSLAGTSSNLIGVIINLSKKNKRSKLYQYYDIVNELQRALHKRGYDIIILATKELGEDLEVVSKRSLDGVFIIDVDDNNLRNLTNQYFVPIILLDSYLEDQLFYEILTDYEAVFEEALRLLGKVDYIVMENYSNSSLRQFAEAHFERENIYVHDSQQDLAQFLLDHSSQKGLILGDILGMQAEHYADNRNFAVVVSFSDNALLLPDTKRILISNELKAEKAAEVMMKLLNMNDNENDEKCIYIKP